MNKKSIFWALLALIAVAVVGGWIWVGADSTPSAWWGLTVLIPAAAGLAYYLVGYYKGGEPRV